MKKLIPPAEADYIRANVLARLGAIRKPVDDAERRRVGGAGGNIADCGELEIIDATGRAVCRCCGQKISKGSLAIKFCYDFTGCGSWTVVEVQIHGEHCTSPTTAVQSSA